MRRPACIITTLWLSSVSHAHMHAMSRIGKPQIFDETRSIFIQLSSSFNLQVTRTTRNLPGPRSKVVDPSGPPTFASPSFRVPLSYLNPNRDLLSVDWSIVVYLCTPSFRVPYGASTGHFTAQRTNARYMYGQL
jgi:hypothetical protein